MANGRSKRRLFSSAIFLGLAVGLSLHAQSPAISADSPPLRLTPSEIRTLVDRYAALYGIPDQAEIIARVIQLESRGHARVRSRSGRYHGLCQFMPRTFHANVEAMKRSGILGSQAAYSPFDPEHAVQVMVWMWSQGHWRQWGPARRMVTPKVRPFQGPPLPPRS